MENLTLFAITFVGLLHVGFLILEMFLWDTPKGHKVFRLDPAFAKQSKTLAANQGLYNGFLAAGLFYSIFLSANPADRFNWATFFLTCVLIAGLYGWKTVSKTILYVQALPALATLILTYMYL
ncbi:MAG: hypothetical protein CL677_03715 [Bdellovibrionaceae bacterium]|nr:hypothetical protein [Pseudobdellovibrionaceae bacterium]|tara:strand:- start:114270 stop:114638 length:369 start_codon:yes stop_codon:yes gene_type:complete